MLFIETTVRSIFYGVFYLVSIPFRALNWIFSFLFFPNKKIDLEEEFPHVNWEEDKEEELVEPVRKVGSVIPVEEDHELRTFEIMNSEGEIFSINTEVEGVFYGPVWTKILHCYETHQPLRGRLTGPKFNRSGKQIGFEVKIGSITAFMPKVQSLRLDNQPAINILVAVTHIDPEKQKVTVSSKVAYDKMFAGQGAPVENSRVHGIFWDFDEHSIYLLLPGNFMAMTEMSELSRQKIATLMGTTALCEIESVCPERHDARVQVLDEEEYEEEDGDELT